MDNAAQSLVLDSPCGLRAEFNLNGALRRLQHGDIVVNLFPGTELEGGPANLYLRRLGESIESTPLLGPRSPGAVSVVDDRLCVRGDWNGIRFDLSFCLSATGAAWFWHVQLQNLGNTVASVDLIYAQDVGLAEYGAIRNNEYYVSQYIDHTPLTHGSRGVVLCARQNLAIEARHPWLMIGSLGHGVSYATDALQLHGLATRAGQTPQALLQASLPGKRQQHEHSMAVLQDARVELAPAATAQRGFFGYLEMDHPAATSADDLCFVEPALNLPEATAPTARDDAAAGQPAASTLFTARPLLHSLDLSDGDIDELFGGERRDVETDASGILSFHTAANRHVVLRRKELQVLRPHGHILRTGEQLSPDEASLSSTCWMNGVFNSLLTQGHVSINRFLSATHSYLSLFRGDGQRVFVQLDDGYHLLDVPSAFAMTPSQCTWIYKFSGGLLRVDNLALLSRHELRLSIDVLGGPPRRFLLAHHVAVNGDDGSEAVPVRCSTDDSGVSVGFPAESALGERFPDGSFRIDAADDTRFESIGADEFLFVDGQSRQQPYLTLVTVPASSLGLRITGHLLGADVAVNAAPAIDAPSRFDQFWSDMTGGLSLRAPPGSPMRADVARLQEIAPWLAHNALIHYLAPHGLEQYSGGGWGTRDVTQGPVELLLSLGKTEPVRDLLLRVFRAQNQDGDWPQWFMFFERERNLRPADSHGDIVFWPVLALAQYLLASQDAAILESVVPFFHADGDAAAESATILAHVERAMELMAGRVIPGTKLAMYGHGDWNDSLQPADPDLADKLCSPWTVTLHHQTLTTLAQALRCIGRAERAQELETAARCILDDFQRWLIADDTLAGFVCFRDDGEREYLLHPRDQRTGIHYRLLPMIHSILNDMLTPEQAARHVDHMRRHLLAADGARLFDRPPRYQGGPQHYFQRAESSTFFGREIGLMYVHAHLRYAEAMAHLGEAEAFFLALRQANPMSVRGAVPNAALRQSNCYYSSSDADFADRHEAAARYREVQDGRVTVEGGWRIYSSGAGIALHLIRRCLLGVRPSYSALVIDPVLPPGLDRLQAGLLVAGRDVRVDYRIKRRGYGPTRLTLNGTALPFERTPNPYRTGGASIALARFEQAAIPGTNRLVVQLG